MRYELLYSTTIQSAHSLPMVPDGHKCKKLHGHTYHIGIAVEGELGADGFVVDYYEIGRAWSGIGLHLDHQNLNDKFNNPTTEHLAEYILREIEYRLPHKKGLHVAAVTVAENDQHACTVRPDAADLRAEPRE